MRIETPQALWHSLSHLTHLTDKANADRVYSIHFQPRQNCWALTSPQSPQPITSEVSNEGKVSEVGAEYDVSELTEVERRSGLPGPEGTAGSLNPIEVSDGPHLVSSVLSEGRHSPHSSCHPPHSSCPHLTHLVTHVTHLTHLALTLLIL
eukprot:GHVN01023310.1.p1 GENE.GHVN01023310.1~~GHVN01023310.1.p1  ORF type:complete len:150 (-),score=77.68 GHVN01023310.1:31-480(-)